MRSFANGFRSLFGAVALLLLGLAVLTLRQWRESSEAMTRSDTAFDEGDLATSLSEARRAAGAYAPGITEVERAHARMVAIATGAEETGNREIAIRAWRAVRGSALEVQHLWSPYESQLRLAEQRLQRLEYGRALAASSVENHPGVGRQRPPPSVGPSSSLKPAGVVLSLLVTTGGLLWSAWAGLTASARWRNRAGVWGLVVAGLGAACWSFAVY